ncbi:MAG: DUF1361 domain-containing protein [Propionibacteriaceae bacterium]|nr:DUF1361 domain-containing protein [Propionibacteriaceae bacterium]
MGTDDRLTGAQIRVGLCACFVYAVTCLGTTLAMGQSFFVLMAWNLFLAVLPLVFSQTLVALAANPTAARWKKVVLSLMWLASFPNAFYVTTDFIHLPNEHWTCADTSCAPSMIFYGRLMIIATGFLLSMYAGLRSLSDIHGLIASGRRRPVAWLVIAAICFLTGIGIYIGRFLRFNSWDLLQPWRIVSEFATRVSARGWAFIAMFTVYSLFLHCCFTLLRQGARRNTPVKGSQADSAST